jgi:pseudaminic acid synthase
MPAYKIASFEIQDIPLIEYAASKGKPIIMSTGIAEQADIQLAVDTCRRVGNNDIILLKCTSSYPAPLELANLNTIPDLKTRFGVEVGFSDHTYGSLAPTVATTLGAKVIEKHFILDKAIGGPDADFSLDEPEFTEMVKAVRDTEKLLGKVCYDISEKVKNNRKFARSLFVVQDVKAGDIISEKNIRSIRPGYGLHPKYYYDILGKTFSENIERGTPLSNELIKN